MRCRMKTDIPYKHVTRETIENMMLRIVYVQVSHEKKDK